MTHRSARSFILVSMPRSGSSWIGAVLSTSPIVKYIFQPFNVDYLRKKAQNCTNENDYQLFLSNVSDCGDPCLRARSISEMFGKEIIPAAQGENRAEVFVMKTVSCHELVVHLAAVSSARIIFLYRHPCAYLFSWLNGPERTARDWEIWRKGRSDLPTETVDWYSGSPNYEMESRGFARWMQTSLLFCQLKRQESEKVYLLSFENVVRNPKSEIARLLDWCGIEWCENVNLYHGNCDTSRPDFYSIYRRPQNLMSWKTGLDRDVISRVQRELNASAELNQLVDSQDPM